jgi:hypothetical protein
MPRDNLADSSRTMIKSRAVQLSAAQKTSNEHIGPIDPYALKIPARRAESPSARTSPHIHAEPKHRKARHHCAAVNAITQPDEALLADEAAQDTQNLILAAKITEIARKEHILAPLARDPGLDLLPQCLASTHGHHPANTRQSLYTNGEYFYIELTHLITIIDNDLCVMLGSPP